MQEPSKPETPQQGPETPQQALDRIFNRKPKSKGAKSGSKKRGIDFTKGIDPSERARSKMETPYEEMPSSQAIADRQAGEESRKKKDLLDRLIESRKGQFELPGELRKIGTVGRGLRDLGEAARIYGGGDTSKTEDLIESRAKKAKLKSKLKDIPGRAWYGAKGAVGDLLKEGEE